MVPRLSMLYQLSAAQMLLFAIIFIAAIIPSVIILRRMGYSGWWALMAPISPLNLIGLWFLAFRKWPVERGITN